MGKQRDETRCTPRTVMMLRLRYRYVLEHRPAAVQLFAGNKQTRRRVDWNKPPRISHKKISTYCG